MTQADSLATRRCGNNDLIKVIKLKGGKKKGEVSDYTVLSRFSRRTSMLQLVIVTQTIEHNKLQELEEKI